MGSYSVNKQPLLQPRCLNTLTAMDQQVGRGHATRRVVASVCALGGGGRLFKMKVSWRGGTRLWRFHVRLVAAHHAY